MPHREIGQRFGTRFIVPGKPGEFSREWKLTSGLTVRASDCSDLLGHEAAKLDARHTICLISDASSKRITKAEEFQRFCELKSLHPAGVLRDYQFAEIIRRLLPPGRTDWKGIKPSMEKLIDLTEMVTFQFESVDRELQSDDAINAWLFRMMHSQSWDQHDMRSIWLRGLFITKEVLPSISDDEFDIASKIEAVLGMRFDEFLFLGFALFAETTEQPGKVFGPDQFANSADFSVNADSAKRFFNLIGCDFVQFGSASIHPDTCLAGYETYSLTPLLRWPALELPDGLYNVPIPRLLLSRLTLGIYYDLVGELDEAESGYFGNVWGSGFEKYVGALINSLPGVSDVIPPAQDGSGFVRCDWLVKFGTHALLIECKTRGITPNELAPVLRTV